MVIIVLAGILVARSYYGSLNRTADPRVLPAREHYATYNRVASSGDFHQLFSLLDRVDSIYLAYPHYGESFERGVIENNRAAACLTLALFRDSLPPGRDPFHGLGADSLVALAATHAGKALEIHEAWFQRYEGKDREELRKMIAPEFLPGLEDNMAEEILENRVSELVQAISEYPRRLSVCHSNLGLACRLRGEYKRAVEEYELALELWDRNLEAENNLNRLLGLPLRKRNFIQRMFPPDRQEIN